MNRRLNGLAAAALLAVVVAGTAHAETSVDLRVSVGDRYNGGTLSYRNEPSVVLVPETKVYYVRDRDYDLYRYGRYWYFIEDGFWYRAASWRGPFLHVRSASVPRAIVVVPVKYRRHWKQGPPPHAVARGYDRNRDYDRGGRGYDHDRGHGKHRGR